MGDVHRMLQLAAVCMITLAGTTFASALDQVSYKVAMGPTSAPMKPGGTGTGNSTTTCSPTDWSCPQPHHATRHRRARTSSQR